MSPDKIIVHHSGSSDGPGNNTAAIRKWHMGKYPNGPADGPYRDIAYHLIIEEINGSYEAIVGRPWDMNGAHTVGQNDKAIGVCLVGNFMMVSPPDAQLRVAARYVAFLCRLYQIPVENVTRHSLWNDTDCPGDWFDLEQFKAMVQDA